MGELGTFIRNERQRRNWTLSDLAKASGISESALSLMERDMRPKTQFETMQKLAAGFGYTIDELLARANGRKAKARVS